jgi:hypothetical protein
MLPLPFLIALLRPPLHRNDTSNHRARELFLLGRRRRSGLHAVV